LPTSEQLVYAENPNFGGPASIKVVSDSGVSGSRGSEFFLSSGNPNIWGTMTYTRPESLNDHIQRYSYSSSVFSGTVASGEIKFDDLENPTKIYISNKNDSGIDISNLVKLSFLSLETIKGSITLNRKIPLQTTANPLDVFALKVTSFSSVKENYVEFNIEKSFKTTTFTPANGEQLIVTFLDRPKLFDVCTNINPYDDGYLDLYTYRNPIFPGESGTAWYNDLALTPAGFPLNLPATFNSNGEASIFIDNAVIPEELLGIAAALTYENISIQFNIIGDNPIAANVGIPAVGGFIFNSATGTFDLTINFKASEYVNGSWSPLTGIKLIHMIVTVDLTLEQSSPS
jgi:hypothetical protein